MLCMLNCLKTADSSLGRFIGEKLKKELSKYASLRSLNELKGI